MKFTRQWTAAEQQAYVDAVLEAVRQEDMRMRIRMAEIKRLSNRPAHRTVLERLEGGRLVCRILNSR